MLYSVLARISKGQGATSEKGTFMRKRWLKKGTLFKDIHINIIPIQTLEMHTAKYFWIVFTIKLKRNNLRHQLKKYMLKRALISL